MEFEHTDILHGDQFTREQIEHILRVASHYEGRIQVQDPIDHCAGKIMGTLFFEPSTRTRLSFETAMHRLGGEVVGFADSSATSVAKGESLEDTIRTVDQYVDLIVMRHPEVGSAQRAADAADSPVINGGDGSGQHPTQALLDLFTVQRELGDLEGAKIALCGDLKFGRTVHAGVELYKHFPLELIFISPEDLQMPSEITRKLRDSGVNVSQETDLEKGLAQADVLYMTRIQKERFADPSEYERLKGRYILTKDMIERTQPEVIILHPLPRVNEISTDVDDLSTAAYFRQVRNGVCVRMALISLLLGLHE